MTDKYSQLMANAISADITGLNDQAAILAARGAQNRPEPLPSILRTIEAERDTRAIVIHAVVRQAHPGSLFHSYVEVTVHGELVMRHAWLADNGPVFNQLRAAAHLVRRSLGIEYGRITTTWDGMTYAIHAGQEEQQ